MLKKELERLKEINKEKEKIEDKLFSQHLKTFCEEKMIFPLVIIGATPSFNDGEPCYHYQNEVSYGGDYEDYIYQEEEIENLKKINNQNLNKPRFINGLKDKKNIPNNELNEHLNKEDQETLSELLSWLEPYFTRQYDTNFKLTIYFDYSKNELAVDKDSYYVD